MVFNLFIFLAISISSKPVNNQKKAPVSILINEFVSNWTQYRIDRTGWTVKANSEQTTAEGVEGPITNIIDGTSPYIWHSKYDNTGAGGHDERKARNDPFQITVNLGKKTTFRAFSYMPRPGSPNGRFGLYDFYVANTEEELNDKILNSDYIVKGNMDKSADISTLVILNTAETGQFVALRSIDPERNFATCAEFNLYSNPPFTRFTQTEIDESTEKFWCSHKIDRSSWSITANSEQTTDQKNEGPVKNVIDGKKETHWHSKYNDNENGGHDERNPLSEPFFFTIDLKEETTFKAFSYMPRQDGSPNGRFNHYEFYVAQTEEEIKRNIKSRTYNAKGDIDVSISISTLVIFDELQKGRFVALLYNDHGQWATCAEFNLYRDTVSYTEQYVVEAEDKFCRSNKIDRSSWSITANSEQTTDQKNEGPVKNVIDGKKETHWHSKYNDNENGGHDERNPLSEPFFFTIDLKEETTFKAFSYMPRQDGSPNGRFEHYEFYVAQTEEELKKNFELNFYQAKGDIDISIDNSKLVIFDKPLTGRFVSLHYVSHGSWATCAEFNLYRDPLSLSPLFMSTYINELTDTDLPQYRMNRTGWTAYANSEQNKEGDAEGPISHIIDGLEGIIWHSRYNKNNNLGHDDRSRGTDPFIITVDMKDEKTFKAFSYMPRQTGNNGQFQHYEFYSAHTSEELYMKIHDNDYLAKGDIDKTKRESTLVSFNRFITGRYVALLSLNHDTFGTCAEFNVYNDTLTSNDADDGYINKDKTGSDIPSQIQAGQGNVKEISSCHFTNININGPKYYIKAVSEFMMYDNVFENTDDASRPGVMFINYNGHLGISNCKFIKIRAPQNNEGFVFNCNTGNNINVVTENSEFINCGAKGERPLISIMSGLSSTKFKDCKFIFDDTEGSCRVLELGTNDCVFDKCKFVNCGESAIYLTRGQTTVRSSDVFQLTNCVVKSNQGRFVNAEQLKSKPIITGNTFEESSLDNNYLIYIAHDQDEIKLTNNTFSDIDAGGADESNCGGLTKFVESSSTTEVTICYEDCKFAGINKNQQARNAQYYHGSILFNKVNNIDANLEIKNCIFRESNAKQSGGAVLITDGKNVNISNCSFESNKAEYGGAVYISSSSLSDTINIENCIFKNNVATKLEGPDEASGGSGLLLYAYTGVIRRCKFKNNEVKIVNNVQSLYSLSIPLEKPTFKLSECSFSVDKTSKFSIFYHGRERKTTLELEKCIFKGDLNDNAYFIDGQLNSKNSLKLIIRDCKFPPKLRKVLNPNSKFELVEIKEKTKEMNKMKIISIVSVFGIAAGAILIITIMKKRSNELNYSNGQEEIEV